MTVDQKSVDEAVEAAFKAMQAAEALAAQVIDPELQGVAGEFMRAAGYPTALWQRVRALERRLQACEGRLQAVEADRPKQDAPRFRLFAWLGRLRTAWPVRQAELRRAREEQGKAERGLR